MSKITAQYVDTCLPDYLTDHHCRPGERLVMSSLGVSIDQAVSEMLDNADDVPDCFDNEEIKTAVREALAGVDLRWIDANGNRADEAPEEHDDEEPMVYVVLRWDASKIKMRLTVDIEYRGNGADPYDLKLVLENLIRHAAGDGALQGGTDAEVTSWGATALDVTNEPEPELADERLRTVQ